LVALRLVLLTWRPAVAQLALTTLRRSGSLPDLLSYFTSSICTAAVAASTKLRRIALGWGRPVIRPKTEVAYSIAVLLVFPRPACTAIHMLAPVKRLRVTSACIASGITRAPGMQ
jgi:hypothetical protein